MRSVFIDVGSQPLRNLIQQPTPTSANNSLWINTNAGPSGSITKSFDTTFNAVLYTQTGNPTDSQFTCRIGASGGAGLGSPARVVVTPGHIYAQTLEVMSDIADGRGFAIDWLDSAGSAVSSTRSGANATGSNFALPASTWVTFTLIAVAPANAASATVNVVWLGASGTNAPQVRTLNSRLWVRKAQFVDITNRFPTKNFTKNADGSYPAAANAYAPPYSDGTYPGWQWAGTATNSESVGYPYTLESIAGKPLYFAENIAQSAASVASVPSGDFTVASVQIGDSTARTNSAALWDVESSLGTQRGRRMLTLSSGYRSDTGKADGTGIVARSYTIDTTVTHTLVGRAHDAGTDWVLDGVVQSVENQTGAQLISTAPNLSLYIGTRDGGVSVGVITTYGIAVWPKRLNDETSKRVAAWFARKYGTTIPSGY